MFDTRLRKAWKDLFVRKGRTFATLFGLSLGLWAVGAATISYYIISTNLKNNPIAGNKAHISAILY